LEMIKKWKEGAKIVLGKRLSRKKDGLLKRFTSWGFYRVMKYLTGGQMQEDTGDFRLLDRAAVDALKLFKEKNRMFKYLATRVGFKTEIVYFDRDERAAGETKYNFKSLLKLAGRGMVESSFKPLHFSSKFGIFFVFNAILAMLTLGALQIFAPNADFSHLHYIIPSIAFIGGMIMIFAGIQGAYIAAVYTEVQNRPIYIIEDDYNSNDETDLWE